MAITYRGKSELPSPEVVWLDSGGVARDFSTGWTFVVLVGVAGAAASFQKTTGITGLDPATNGGVSLRISWGADELTALAPGTYSVDIEATYTATGQSITQSIQIEKQLGILPPA